MLYCGIDWGEQALEYHLRTRDGELLTQGSVKPNPAGMAELFATLDRHGPADQIGIGIETAHGAWVQALLDRGYVVYPLNPKTVDVFRKALSATVTYGFRNPRAAFGLAAAPKPSALLSQPFGPASLPTPYTYRAEARGL